MPIAILVQSAHAIVRQTLGPSEMGEFTVFETADTVAGGDPDPFVPVLVE